jgi:hypothetical protein
MLLLAPASADEAAAHIKEIQKSRIARLLALN